MDSSARPEKGPLGQPHWRLELGMGEEAQHWSNAMAHSMWLALGGADEGAGALPLFSGAEKTHWEEP